MADALPANASALSEKSLAVALITLARYLAERDPEFVGYLKGSLEHACASSLDAEDLAVLRLIIKAVGG